MGGVYVGGVVANGNHAHIFFGGGPHRRRGLLPRSKVRRSAAAFSVGDAALRAAMACSRVVGKLSSPFLLGDNLWCKPIELHAARVLGVVWFVHIKDSHDRISG